MQIVEKEEENIEIELFITDQENAFAMSFMFEQIHMKKKSKNIT